MSKLIQELLSQSKIYKATICQRNDGDFEIETWKWTRYADPESGFESEFFWEPFPGRSITDTLDSAQVIAREALRACSGEASEAYDTYYGLN